MGESVSDARCVQGGTAGENSDAALYVVGGTSSNSGYSGLQRYLFDDGRWETIALGQLVTQNRLRHGAAYLQASSSILVYGGSQDGTTAPSTQTFTISTTPPYNVNSLPSQGAPLVVSPSLLPWDNQTAVLIGGSANANVFLFSTSSGWVESKMSLAASISDELGVATILDSDGSRILEIFNTSVSPNTVSSIALMDAGGVPAPRGQQVGTANSSASSSSSHIRRRDVTLASFPAYNGSLAPTTIRNNFSLAQSSDGKVVISGGSSTDPLCIFDQFQNSWVNVTKLFNGDEDDVQRPLPTASSSSTMTSASTATSSSPTSPSSSSTIGTDATNSPSSIRMIIGATLGSLLGLAVILIIILLVLRRQTRKQKPPGKHTARRYSADNKNRLSFQDQGLEPLARAAYPMALGPVPSVDSLAIISGKAGSPRATAVVGSPAHLPSPNPQKPNPVPRVVSRWPDGTTRLHSGLVEAPVARSPPDERPRGDRTTDEGWSKYFKDIGDTTLAVEPARSTRSSQASNETKSDYRSSQWPSVPGIALGVLDEPHPLNRVQVGSPSTELFPSKEGGLLHQSQMAKISSVDSLSIVSEDDDQDPVDAFSSGVPASINDESSWLEVVSERPQSSNYTGSYYPPSLSHGMPDQSNNNMLGIDDGRVPWSELDNKNQEHSQRLRRDNINSDMSWLNLNGS